MTDAIVVFGGGIRPDGSLEENSLVRVRKAVQLWMYKRGPVIVMSGAWSASLLEPPARTEADAMAEYAVQLGCPNECVLKEGHSKETIGNAYFVKTLFVIPNHWHDLNIVAADYHLPRVRSICQQVFGPEYGLTFTGALLPMTPLERTEREIREQALSSLFTEWVSAKAGDHQAVWDVMSQIHPAYAEHPKFTRDELKLMVSERIERIRNENTA